MKSALIGIRDQLQSLLDENLITSMGEVTFKTELGYLNDTIVAAEAPAAIVAPPVISPDAIVTGVMNGLMAWLKDAGAESLNAVSAAFSEIHSKLDFVSARLAELSAPVVAAAPAAPEAPAAPATTAAPVL